MELVKWIAIFVVSVVVLVKAADFFTGAAEKIGLALGIAPFVVGVVIVGFGTSLPELVSSILSVVAGSSEIVIGSVLGSNITNIFLVLGLAAVCRKMVRIRYDVMHVDLPILMGSSLLIAFMVLDRHFSLGEAILCLLCLGFYIVSSIVSTKPKAPVKAESEHGEESKPRPRAGFLVWLLLVGSAFFIFLGAKFVVDAVIAVSGILSIGKDVIALSAVAIGTSLPEVTVAISAVRRGNAELVLGNIIGSNIFNSFAVLGIPSLFGSPTIPEGILKLALPLSVAASLMAIIIVVDRKLNRWEGALLLVFYAFFLGSLFGWV